MLEQILDLKMIDLNIEANSWDDSIKKAAIPLIDNNKITDKYVDNIINAVHELGPYFVIMPGVAFAHARPDESVIETCISMITLKNPVKFNQKQNDPVKIVFVFGAENGADHLEALQDIAKFLMVEENIDFLVNATNKEAVLERLLNI